MSAARSSYRLEQLPRCKEELDLEYAKEHGIDVKEVGLSNIKQAIINALFLDDISVEIRETAQAQRGIG